VERASVSWPEGDQMKRRVSFVKVCFITAALTTLVMIDFSQTCFAQEGLTGHTWRRSSRNDKTVLVRGFLMGYMLGYGKGNLIGFAETYAWATLICKDEKGNPCISINRATVKEVMKEVQTVSKEPKVLEVLEYSFGHYVKELDSFYEAFPLCRGETLDFTLAKLAAMWLGIAEDSENSYNKIGSACGDKK